MMTNRLRPLAVLVALAAPIASAFPQTTSVAYADFGRAWLGQLGESEPPPLKTMLERHYALLPLLDMHVYVPKAMLDGHDGSDRAAEIAMALLDLEARIGELTIVEPAARTQRCTDIEALRKYVAAWRKKPSETAPPAIAPVDFPCVLVLAPDRRNFVAVVGWLGLLKKQYQDYWWNDGTAQFADLRVQDEGHVQVVALEYAAPKQNGDVTLGFDMNTRERTGLLQHVLQRAGLQWCWRWLGDEADQPFVLGFATCLVTDVLGQNNARSGGNNKSIETEGRAAFIPGAPSSGGSMEIVNADSKWRLSQGKDYFARPLRHAQKAGLHEARTSKDKLGHFLLDAPKGEEKHLVTAPFLGAAAYDRKEIPALFLDDYLEFHRAYRAGFVHWLEDHGDKKPATSLDRFRQLMHALMAIPPRPTFEAACSQVYAVPLSAKDAETDTLERHFLAWLTANTK